MENKKKDLLDEARWAEEKGELERAQLLRDAADRNKKLLVSTCGDGLCYE